MTLQSNKENLDNVIEENANTNSKDSLQEKKDKLKKEIKELKRLIYQTKCNVSSFTFGDIHRVVQSSKPFEVTREMVKNIENIESKIQRELWRYTGLYSVKINQDEYIFNFLSSHKLTNDNLYSIQILCNEDRVKIGRWIMPMSIDMHEILTETPVNHVGDIKSFLKNCKHHIDCYTCRMEQYNGLEAALNDVNNCKLDTNLGYTRVRLQLAKVKEIDSEQLYNIIVYLFYKSGEARPCKLEVESDNKKKLSVNTINKLKSYLRNFKQLELKVALERTINVSEAEFLWTQKIADKETANENKSKRKRQEESDQTKTKRTKSYKSRINVDSNKQLEQNDLSDDLLRIPVNEITEQDKTVFAEEISQGKATSKARKVKGTVRSRKSEKQQKKDIKGKNSGKQKVRDVSSQRKDSNDKSISHSNGPVEQVANVLQDVEPKQSEVSSGARKQDSKVMNNDKIAVKCILKRSKKRTKGSQNKSKDNLRQTTLNVDVLQDNRNDNIDAINNRIESRRRSIRWMDEAVLNEIQSDDLTSRSSTTVNNKFLISSTPIREKARVKLKIPSEISKIQRFFPVTR